jgi:hypothetical protein
MGTIEASTNIYVLHHHHFFQRLPNSNSPVRLHLMGQTSSYQAQVSGCKQNSSTQGWTLAKKLLYWVAVDHTLAIS